MPKPMSRTSLHIIFNEIFYDFFIMKVGLSYIAKYFSKFFDKKGQKNDAKRASDQDDTRKRILNHFLEEGFSFWRDPFHYFRKNFVIRAGP